MQKDKMVKASKLWSRNSVSSSDSSPSKSVNKNYLSRKWMCPLKFQIYLKEMCTAPWDADVLWQNVHGHIQVYNM